MARSLPFFFTCLFAFASVSPSFATTAPNEVTIHAGYDANGAAWSVSAGREKPLAVFGPKRFTPVLSAPVAYLAMQATLDGDTLWIADSSARVISVNLTSGASREFTLTGRLMRDISARGGVLFGASSETAGEGIWRFDPGTNRSEKIMELKRPTTLLTLTAGPSHVWVAMWTGLAGPRMSVEFHGLPLAAPGGTSPRRVTRETDWGTERWSGFALHEDAAGSLWVSNTYAARVERLDPAGVWTSWSMGTERLDSIALNGSLAVALVATMGPEPQNMPTGFFGPMGGRPTLSESLLVLGPGPTDVTTTPLRRAPGVPERLGVAGGKVWISSGREVRVVGGQAVVGPK